MNNLKTFSEMYRLDDYRDRFEYLSLRGFVGEETFGYDRHYNQAFYRSTEWRRIRNEVIVRDDGCDLSHPDHPIGGKILIHHINPISLNDIVHGSDLLFDMNNLVCVSHDTHNAIHYGDVNLLPRPFVERRRGDTTLW